MSFITHRHDSFWTIILQRMEEQKIHDRIQKLENYVSPYLEARIAQCVLDILAFQAYLAKNQETLLTLRRHSKTVIRKAMIDPRFEEQCLTNLKQINTESLKISPSGKHLPSHDFDYPADREFQRANNGVSGATFLRKGLKGECYVIKFQDLSQTEIEFFSTLLYQRIIAERDFPITMAAAQCCFPSLPDQPTQKLSSAKKDPFRSTMSAASPLGNLNLNQIRKSFFNQHTSKHSHDNLLVSGGLPCFFEFMPGTTFLALCDRSLQVRSHISKLSPTMLAKMFYQFGYIGGLDFYFGNFDRFIPLGFGEKGYHTSSINGGNILIKPSVDRETGDTSLSSISLIDNTPAFRIFFSTIPNSRTGKEEEGRVVLQRKFSLFIRGNQETIYALATQMFQDLTAEITQKDLETGQRVQRHSLQPFIYQGLQQARWDLSSARFLNQCTSFLKGIGDRTSERTAIFLDFLRSNLEELIEIHHLVASYPLKLNTRLYPKLNP